jgi:hypothetical protein
MVASVVPPEFGSAFIISEVRGRTLHLRIITDLLVVENLTVCERGRFKKSGKRR